MLGVHSRTDPAWTKTALSDEIALLRDHGHPRRKAAGHVIILIGQEARSCEHFCLLAEAATGDLQELFHDLKESEAGHHAFFIKLAHEHWPRDELKAGWNALAPAEAAIVADTEWGPRVH